MTDQPPDPASSLPPLWERQEGEGHKAWEAFVAYRDLGTMRTMPKARESLGLTSHHLRQWEEWSGVHSWTKRCAAFDNHMDRVRREAVESETAEAARRQVSQAKVIQEALYAPSAELQRRLEANPKLLKDLSDSDLIAFVRATATPYTRVGVFERLVRGEPEGAAAPGETDTDEDPRETLKRALDQVSRNAAETAPMLRLVEEPPAASSQ